MGSNWWKGGVIYQIYPRSYMDSNGDGVGDLPGITEKMGYIASLGVDAIWLSPFFTSPMLDFGYDISDYRDVDPLFGTLDDFDRLVEAAHAKGLKVMIDQVLSHTSNQHPWFLESERDRVNPKADWYVWADPKEDGCPPSNWLSYFGGSSWQWHAKRMQYYLHNFLTSQPDLNYHNPEVRQAILDVLKFWLDRGVDGFRLDTVNLYFHDKEFRSNPPFPKGQSFTTVPSSNPFAFQQHLYDKSRPENLDFLADMRILTDSYPDRAMVGELSLEGDAVGPGLASYTEEGKRLHMSYVFELMTDEFSATHIRTVVERLTREINNGWICWSLSNHDVVRVLTRWGLADKADRAAPFLVALLASLRGSICLYEGEELGLAEADIPYDRIQDPYGKVLWPEFKGRDGCRTPMPWEKDAPNAGFTTGTPWLPIPDEHRAKAVDIQERDANSILNRCRLFMAWRQKQSLLRTGDITFLDAPANVLAFIRSDGEDRLIAVFNLNDAAVDCPIPEGYATTTGHGFTGTLDGNTVRVEGFNAFFGTNR